MNALVLGGTTAFLSSNNAQNVNEINCLVDENDNLDHSIGLARLSRTKKQLKHKLR